MWLVRYKLVLDVTCFTSKTNSQTFILLRCYTSHSNLVAKQ